MRLLSVLCALSLGLGLVGCDDDPASGTEADASTQDLGLDAGEQGDALVDPDMAQVDPDMAQVDPDMAQVDPDMAQVVDPDMGPQPDVGPLDGAPCDPRLLAAACEMPGHYCVHVPGSPDHVGACQEGDACNIVDGSGCDDPDAPYCHLKGGSTVCSPFGALRAGDDCVDDNGAPQACEAGLVCNNSVCQQPCDPAAADPECPNEGRCADISARTNAPGGLCAPRGCDWFTGEGCEGGQKCTYAIRNDGALIGSCRPTDGPGNTNGSPCGLLPEGGDNCGAGLVCIGPPDAQRFCRILCDTGGYEAPCPSGQRCVERLGTQLGPVRGYGICITNQ